MRATAQHEVAGCHPALGISRPMRPVWPPRAPQPHAGNQDGSGELKMASTLRQSGCCNCSFRLILLS